MKYVRLVKKSREPITPQQLKDWRLKNSLSQTEAGELFGVKHLQFLRWEKGQCTIPPYVRTILHLLH